MTTIRKESGGDEPDRYSVPATLVHRLIIAIFGALLSLAGYMVVWAINDASWRTTINGRLEGVIANDARMEMLTRDGILPIARQRIEDLERRVSRLEQVHQMGSQHNGKVMGDTPNEKQNPVRSISAAR